MTPQLPPWHELRLVLPELWLAVAMCAVILVPFVRRASQTLPALTALVGTVLALGAAVLTLGGVGPTVFHDTLAIDPFSQFFKVILLLFTLLVIVQWFAVTRRETAVGDTPDFLCLLLGAALGMALMASANHLVMIFIATEAASFPSYALAGFRKRHRVGSEGSLKYVVFGSASSAIMVYGMSLIYGMTGTLSLPGVAEAIVQGVPGSGIEAGASPLLAVGILAMFAGIAFKLSAVPLHFWCPDVFQGAPTEVTTFLSVASKGAAVALLLRVLMTFGAAVPPVVEGEFRVDYFTGLAVGVAILGAVTATWGNLVALHQVQIKRLLAYSSIAHAGYMIMAASLVVFTAGRGVSGNTIAGAILFYLVIYLFMNLGAFTVAAMIANRAGTEDIREYAGLFGRSPLLSILMLVFLLSLFGMPGLGGFAAKIFLGTAIADSGVHDLGRFALIAVLFINTLLSLYYYVRPVYYMILVPDRQQRSAFGAFGSQAGGGVLVLACAVVLLLTGTVLIGPLRSFVQEFATFRYPFTGPHARQMDAPAPGPGATTATPGATAGAAVSSSAAAGRAQARVAR